jgi:hypothetical protein
VLDPLFGDTRLPPDGGKVARLLHPQQATEVVVSILAPIARRGPKTVGEALPGLPQLGTQPLNRLERQSPTLGIKQIGLFWSSDIHQLLQHAHRFRNTLFCPFPTTGNVTLPN